jgi:uncharacterized repeat protein (TIGR01451 family)
LLACVLASNKAQAIGVPAGTTINNTAEVSYSVGSVNSNTASNQVTLTVAEIVDVLVTAQTDDVDVDAGDTQRVLVFLVRNNGNFTETFRLQLDSVIGGDQFDPVPSTPAIYFDTNADNVISAGDTQYVPGSNDPVLSADGEVRVLVVHDIPAGVVDANFGIVRLAAISRTGTGPAGTVFAAQGNGIGNVVVDAVIGLSEGDSNDTATYTVTGVTLTAAKTQTVTGGPGNANLPVPGALVTYSVVINVTGTGTAANAVFVDNIPANTTYVAGSLRFNSATLTDSAADDAGELLAAASPNPARVNVRLGSLDGTSGPQTVAFTVQIN